MVFASPLSDDVQVDVGFEVISVYAQQVQFQEDGNPFVDIRQRQANFRSMRRAKKIGDDVTGMDLTEHN